MAELRSGSLRMELNIQQRRKQECEVPLANGGCGPLTTVLRKASNWREDVILQLSLVFIKANTEKLEILLQT